VEVRAGATVLSPGAPPYPKHDGRAVVVNLRTFQELTGQQKEIHGFIWETH
jgi:hypothetical protein